MSKRKDCLITFRLGIFIMAFFFLAVIIFQEKVASFPVFFGMLNGLAQGFYWIAMLVLAYEVTTNENRLRYFGWDNGAMALAGILGPFMSGYMIDWFPGLTGYIVVFAGSFGLFILTIVGSLFVKKETFRSQTFLLSFIFKRDLKKQIWKKHFLGWFIIGIREGVILLLPPIILYHIVHKESIVGLLTVLFGVVSIVSNQLLGRFGKKEYYHFYVLFAAVGLTVTTLVLLLFKISITTVLIFMIGNAFFDPQIRNSYTCHMYCLMSGLPNGGKKLKTELIATRQIFLNLGRILPVLFFMMYADGIEYRLIAWLLVITAVTQLILYFVMVSKNRISQTYDGYHSLR